MDKAPVPAEIEHNTNVDALAVSLGGLIGIEDDEQFPPEGATRTPIRATLRHALTKSFQRQRIVADPGPREPRGRDRRARGRRCSSAALARRGATRRPARGRHPRRRSGRSPAAGRGAEAAHGRAGDGRRSAGSRPRRPRRAQRSARFGVRAAPGGPSRATTPARPRTPGGGSSPARPASTSRRSRRCGLLPEPDGDRAGDARCALCGADHEQPDPTAEDLRASLQRAGTQLNLARIDEPRLSDAIGELDAAERALRADLRAIEQQLAALLDRREAVRRAQGLLEEQAFVRGQIAGFHEHPPLDEARVRALEAEVEVAAARVQRLERALSTYETRARTENALNSVGSGHDKDHHRVDLTGREALESGPELRTRPVGTGPVQLWRRRRTGPRRAQQPPARWSPAEP